MGWISDRYMREGGSLNKRLGQQKRGPLREVVERLYVSLNMFVPDRVRLSCGHLANSWGGARVRCDLCWDEEQASRDGGHRD